MVEERITETRAADGGTHTHTTVITDEPRRRGGSWAIVAILAIALVVGIWAFSQFGAAEAAKDNAIAGAANEVGAAAQQVGDAAQTAAGTLDQ